MMETCFTSLVDLRESERSSPLFSLCFMEFQRLRDFRKDSCIFVVQSLIGTIVLLFSGAENGRWKYVL